MKQVKVSAPSNIAIIKYMGKVNPEVNLPSNPSISYTLDYLRSFVELEEINGQDYWEALIDPNLKPIQLSQKGKDKFLNHLVRLKKKWNYTGGLIVRSANNFPSDCGIASSSSSFAALTLAAAKIMNKDDQTDLSELSSLSRQGSGSSCRSFFSPWAIWDGDFAKEWHCTFNDLDHGVILIDESIKEVSSSEAHLRVTSSPYFIKRSAAVINRINHLKIALDTNNWSLFCDIAWDEFQEMHTLFETSVPPFTYRTNTTAKILDRLLIYSSTKDKLCITMDAGNNIHLLFPRLFRKKVELLLLDIESNFGSKFMISWMGNDQ